LGLPVSPPQQPTTEATPHSPTPPLLQPPIPPNFNPSWRSDYRRESSQRPASGVGMTPRGWAFLAAAATTVLLAIILIAALSRGPEKSNPTAAPRVTTTVTQTLSAPATPTGYTAAPRLAPDADIHGFVVFSGGARCFNTDSALLLMRTEKSALVVCRSEINRPYYRGYRISDGAAIDLYDVSPQADGYVAVNARDNARYVITRSGFQLIQNGDIVSSESAVEIGP
jgi:hypothetical protein